MVGLEPVIQLIETVLWSGQVEQERPLSILLVAPPGTGKTTVIDMVECPTAHFFSDFTSREVKSALSGDQQLTHLLIGDFLSVFGHNKSTVKLSINLLARLTGEKIKQMPWSGEEIKPRALGIISGIPPDDLNRRDIKVHVRTGGFASRFLIANYTYSQKTIEKVHRWIRDGKYTKEKPFVCDVKAGAFKIEIPKGISEKVSALSLQIKRDPIGFRAHLHTRALIKAIARMDRRPVVKEKDYEKLLDFCEFFTERGKIL